MQSDTNSIANLLPPGVTITADSSSVPSVPPGWQMVQPVIKATATPRFRSPAPHVPTLRNRISIEINSMLSGRGKLEMTVDQPVDGWVQFTMLIPGKQAIDFQAHVKDIEALMGNLTLMQLAK